MATFPAELEDASAAVWFRNNVLPDLVRRVNFDGGPEWLQVYGSSRYHAGTPGYERVRAMAFHAVLLGHTGTVDPESLILDHRDLPSLEPPPTGWHTCGVGQSMQLARAAISAEHHALQAAVTIRDPSSLASARRKAEKLEKFTDDYIPAAHTAVAHSSRAWLATLAEIHHGGMPGAPPTQRIGKW